MRSEVFKTTAFDRSATPPETKKTMLNLAERAGFEPAIPEGMAP